jgi:hypothetical protein
MPPPPPRFGIGTVLAVVNENTCLESTGFGCWGQKRQSRRSPAEWRRRVMCDFLLLSQAFASASSERTNADMFARAGYAWP